MNRRPNLFQQFSRRNFIALLLLLAFATPLDAKKLHYLSKENIDPTALLAPPPPSNSLEQAADLATVVAAHKQCSTDDEALAKSEKKIYVFNFASVLGTFFKSNSLPKTAAFFERINDDTSEFVDVAKDYWKRPRPFLIDTNIVVSGDLETSFGYPSGHSTKAIVFACVLAEIFPENREEIFTIGRTMGWHRVQLGRHYPTDVQAGRVLGQAISREFKKDSFFEKDLVEVKKEIVAAKQIPTRQKF